MDASAIVEQLKTALPDASFEVADSIDLHATFYTSRHDVLGVLKELRDNPALRFQLLAEVTAVDYWPREPRFELIYLLVSFEHRARVRLKVRL
ncbi:MAG: NADH-quinone oxidoreductase subunit C, partial [Acidobacteriaceae bacterium]|nr:NADH-quinone oxidoreductase subunit C [Acidobacteriaceae bacterium]